MECFLVFIGIVAVAIYLIASAADSKQQKAAELAAELAELQEAGTQYDHDR